MEQTTRPEEGSSTSRGHASTSPAAANYTVPNGTDNGQNLAPDFDTVVQFLKTVYPEYPVGVVGFTAFTVTGRSVNIPQRMGEWTAAQNNGTATVHDHEWLAERMIRISEGVMPQGKETGDSEYFLRGVPVTGIFLRVPTTMAEWPTGNQRGGQSNVKALVGFVLDGDIGDEGHKRNKDGLPNPSSPTDVQDIWAEAIAGKPTMTWISGNGVNGFWGLDKPVVVPDGEEGAAVLAAWRAASQRFHERVVRTAKSRGLHHDSVPNNDRLMRVAGTVNAKVGTTPKLSTILTSDGPRYALAELLALAPEPVETEDGTLVDAITGEVVREARKFRAPTGSGYVHSAKGGFEAGETSWEHYNREMWETGGFLQMIQLDGFTPEGYHGGTLHLWRPGKGPGEQISATFGANEAVGAMSYGAKFYSWSDNAPGLLGMPKWTGGALHRFVDPYEYLVFTRYNGDWKACSSALYHLGYGSRYSDGQSTETGDERVKRIALEAAHAVRTSTNWPDTVARQAIRLAQERVPQKVTEAVLAHACLWSPEQLQRVNAYVTAAYKAVNSASA
jgi:hypothetical protein